jgi:hypothetical protein
MGGHEEAHMRSFRAYKLIWRPWLYNSGSGSGGCTPAVYKKHGMDK